MRAIRTVILIISFLLVTVVDIAHGQDLHPRLLDAHRIKSFYSPRASLPIAVQDTVDRPSIAALGLGGVLGWGAGAAVGGYAGYMLIDRHIDMQHFPGGTVLGGLAGAAVLTPLGVHLANKRQGNYLLDLLGGIAATAGSVYLVGRMLPVDHRLAKPLVAGMITVQIAVPIAIERSTAR